MRPSSRVPAPLRRAAVPLPARGRVGARARRRRAARRDERGGRGRRRAFAAAARGRDAARSVLGRQRGHARHRRRALVRVGGRRFVVPVGVHVADVASRVACGSALFAWAAERGASAYFGGVEGAADAARANAARASASSGALNDEVRGERETGRAAFFLAPISLTPPSPSLARFPLASGPRRRLRATVSRQFSRRAEHGGSVPSCRPRSRTASSRSTRTRRATRSRSGCTSRSRAARPRAAPTAGAATRTRSRRWACARARARAALRVRRPARRGGRLARLHAAADDLADACAALALDDAPAAPRPATTTARVARRSHERTRVTNRAAITYSAFGDAAAGTPLARARELLRALGRARAARSSSRGR